MVVFIESMEKHKSVSEDASLLVLEPFTPRPHTSPSGTDSGLTSQAPHMKMPLDKSLLPSPCLTPLVSAMPRQHLLRGMP